MVNEGVNKSRAKDERLSQRRLVSAAANEVLYQLSPAIYTQHPHKNCVSARTRGTPVIQVKTYNFVTHEGKLSLKVGFM